MAATKTVPQLVLEAYASPIGKKAVMSLTGLVLFGFLIGHLLGNLQIFESQQKFDDYAHFLHDHLGLLWGTRVVLLVSLVLHVASAASLESLKSDARVIPYQGGKNWRAASLSSRTMLVTGGLLIAFVVFHLAHFTFGWSAINTSFEEGNVYHNVVSAFRGPVIALVYVAGMAVLFFHLQHGLWSLKQSLGLRGHTESRKALSATVAALMALGFAIIPLAILAGLVTEHAK
jgi:succinate dehydrogenase / fumarate reductase cytochrome b subunit